MIWKEDIKSTERCTSNLDSLLTCYNNLFMVKPKPWKACWVWIELATFSLIRIIVTVVLIITNILPFDAKPVLTFPSFVSFYRSTGFIDCCSATFWELVWVSLFIAWISGWATNVAFSMPGCASRFCQLMNLENSCCIW